MSATIEIDATIEQLQKTIQELDNAFWQANLDRRDLREEREELRAQLQQAYERELADEDRIQTLTERIRELEKSSDPQYVREPCWSCGGETFGIDGWEYCDRKRMHRTCKRDWLLREEEKRIARRARRWRRFFRWLRAVF